MKNFKTALLILFTVVIIILVFFLVKNLKKDNYSKEGEKIISEIKYMDNKLTYLLNTVNNINFNLEENRILTGTQDTNWEIIKNEIEVLYSSVPTLTLDLYKMNVNQDDILNFNKELDELTLIAKSENKEQTLIKLANLYRYLPAYASSIPNNSDFTSLLETKSNVFNGYVFSNTGNWDEVSNYTRKAVESYSRVLNNLNENGNNYDSNKIYIILNELQNAANLKDKDVFFIKYKSFLEETEKKNAK